MRTITYSPGAVVGLYKIPRGIVAHVTAAIKALAVNARPYGCDPVDGRPGLYRIVEYGHIVEYEIRQEAIRILFIE